MVIVDKGIILTNLHVVQGASVIRIEFSDGLETTASVTGAQPENDLAVLQAHKIPDDLIAATMRSTHDLVPGDEVLAVGFPFGIGPSASAGVSRSPAYSMMRVPAGMGRMAKAPIPWMGLWRTSNGRPAVTFMPESHQRRLYCATFPDYRRTP